MCKAQVPTRQDIDRLLAKARAGDAASQYELGKDYERGLPEVPKDLGKAFAWFQRSAEKGFPKAQNAMGIAFQHGYGVPENDSLGFEWLYKAALRGYAPAQFNLAVAYHKGRGVAANDSEAFNWFLESARGGNSAAQVALCAVYQRGELQDRDPTMAYAWCLIARPTDPARAETLKRYKERVEVGLAPSQFAEAHTLASSWNAASGGRGTLPVHSRAYLAVLPAPSLRASEPSPSPVIAPSRGSACESGHWVDSVLRDGEIVKLEDGSVWKIDDADAVDSSLWLSTDDVIVCDGKLIDTDDGTTVAARRLH
jgi:hypothetical protein